MTVCKWTGCNSKIVVGRHCQDVTIPLLIQGFPRPRVRWLRYNRQRRQYTLLRANHHVSINDTHFVLRRAQFSDTGSYRVRLDNNHGSAKITFALKVTANDTLISQCQHNSLVKVPKPVDCVMTAHLLTVVHGQETSCQPNTTTTATSKATVTTEAKLTINGAVSHASKEDALASDQIKSIHHIPETGISCCIHMNSSLILQCTVTDCRNAICYA